jgi:hypothetical protein
MQRDDKKAPSSGATLHVRKRRAANGRLAKGPADPAAPRPPVNPAAPCEDHANQDSAGRPAAMKRVKPGQAGPAKNRRATWGKPCA